MIQVLNQSGKWSLNKVGTTKHFKKGRPNLHVEITYSVEWNYNDGDESQRSNSRFWIKSKSEALKYFKIVTNTKLDALQKTNAIAVLDKKLIGE